MTPKRKLKQKSEGLWMATFADLSLTLMALFALLLSFSTINKKKFENVTSGMKSEEQSSSQQPNKLKEMADVLQQKISQEKLAASVKLEAEGLRIELDEKVLFRSGSATIEAPEKKITQPLLSLLAATPKQYLLTLEGHTDDIPLGGNATFKDNWELSSARARSLLMQLKSLGVPEERMTVTAFAHTRPRIKIEGKDPRQHREARAKNRRVVVWLR